MLWLTSGTSWKLTFDLKLCLEKSINENSSLWQFQIFSLFLSWNENIESADIYAGRTIQCRIRTVSYGPGMSQRWNRYRSIGCNYKFCFFHIKIYKTSTRSQDYLPETKAVLEQISDRFYIWYEIYKRHAFTLPVSYDRNNEKIHWSILVDAFLCAKFQVENQFLWCSWR